jgi:DNA-directed RNA polymerase specialized sigma24 family protein
MSESWNGDAVRKQRNELERYKQNLLEQLRDAASRLKKSLEQDYHLFRFNNDALDEVNRKRWESIRAEWRRNAGQALTDTLPAILKISVRREKAAERQGIVAAELFVQTIVQEFCWPLESGRVMMLPSGLGECEEIYREESHWIESVLYRLLGPARKSLNLSRSQRLRVDAAGLTNKQRECFSLRSEYGLSEQAMANKLKLSRAAVRERLKAASKKISQSPIPSL